MADKTAKQPVVVKITVEFDGTVQTFILDERSFSSGSRGYHAQGKVNGTEGRRYQANLMLVEIGSKPTK